MILLKGFKKDSARDAARLTVQTENLWFGLIVLDRVMTDKRSSLGATITTLFRPIREEVQEVSCLFLDSLISFLQGDGTRPAPSPYKVKKKVAIARKVADDGILRFQRPQSQ